MDINSEPGRPVTWVVANTHPHKEKFALENLERQKFESYCPMTLKRAQRPNRKRPAASQDSPRPLFPGYVFIQVPADRLKWRPILSTYGVRNLIRFGAQIASLDQRFIQALKMREIDGLVSRPETAYAIGDRITITGGPFDGVIATILSLSEKDRLVVLMDVLSRPVKVRLDGWQASPLAAAS